MVLRSIVAWIRHRFALDPLEFMGLGHIMESLWMSSYGSLGMDKYPVMKRYIDLKIF